MGIFLFYNNLRTLVKSGVKIVNTGVTDFMIKEQLPIRSIFEVWNGMK
jgi:hypothetical protein